MRLGLLQALLATPVVGIEGVLFYNADYLGFLTLGALLARAIPARPVPEATDHRRFAVLIPAHDEAHVLGPLLESLERQAYPKDRYEVHVVADNCKDATAQVARLAGVGVHERITAEPSTKGKALKWLWQELAGLPGSDAVVLLDADNLVDPAFLATLNRHMAGGYEVVQGVRVAKNPADSRASSLDTLSESLHNLVNAPGRHFWGMPGHLSGSGVAFARDRFAALIGALSESLVEDCEWQLKLQLAGVPVRYAAEAVVYDEKVGSFSDLTTQRTRWIRGKLLLWKDYAGPLLGSLLRGRAEGLEGLSFLLTMLPRTLLMGGLLVGWLAALFAPGIPGLAPLWAWHLMLGLLIAYLLTGLVLDGAPPRRYLALLWSPLFALHFLRAVARALMRRQVGWVATSHTAAKRIGEIE